MKPSLSLSLRTFSPRAPAVAAFVIAFVAAMCLAIQVWAAQGGSPAPAPAVVPPTPGELAIWCTAGAAALGALASILREDNTFTKWAPTVVARFLIVVVLGGIAQACLMAIAAGTPWPTAIATAVASAGVAWAKDGKRVAPGLTVAEAALSKSGRPPPMVPPPAGPPAAPSVSGVAV